MYDVIVGAERRINEERKGIVFEDFGDVSTIANCKLRISIHNCRAFFDSTFKFKYNNRDTVYKNDTVGNTSLIVDAVDLKLIYDLKNVVVEIFKVNKLNENILLGSILTIKNEPIRNELVHRLISLVNRAGNIAQR